MIQEDNSIGRFKRNRRRISSSSLGVYDYKLLCLFWLGLLLCLWLFLLGIFWCFWLKLRRNVEWGHQLNGYSSLFFVFWLFLCILCRLPYFSQLGKNSNRKIQKKNKKKHLHWKVKKVHQRISKTFCNNRTQINHIRAHFRTKTKNLTKNNKITTIKHNTKPRKFFSNKSKPISMNQIKNTKRSN